MSLYMETRIMPKHREQLQHLDIGKSCIRFKKVERLPLDTIRTMLKQTVRALDADQV
jgi:hypothetical protein